VLRTRSVAAAAILLMAHITLVATLGTSSPGPFLSDLIQLTLGGLLVFACFQANRRSEGLPRSFWRLTAAAYLAWFSAQGIGTYADLFLQPGAAGWITNLLFSFWFAPLAMALLLDPDREAGGLDALLTLDFVQAIIVCIAAYLYFFYLPKSESHSELARSVWNAYFFGYSFVAGSFLLRAIFSRSRDVRILFGRFGVFLSGSGVVDALYYYGPGRGLKTGAWFDILWTVLLIVPLLIAASWKQAEKADAPLDLPKHEKKISTQIFYLLYPLFVLIMSLRVAHEHLGLATAVVLLSFACSSARLLLTQHRLILTKEELRREASRDSLTRVWNRKAIMEILQRELLRAERETMTVGVIMADIDHFKAVNDSRGHAAGDLVLQTIASEIAAVVRPYDSVGRYGGEEFLIVVPGCNMSETWELAERIRGCVVASSITVGNSPVKVSLSLGVATGNLASDSDKLLSVADTALYQAKNAGRNRVEPHLASAATVAPNSPHTTNRGFGL
jgi:diguanylate cyclase (GGDEF)-like protein